MTSVITLLTDFGIQDSYVAQMKGVILGIAPGAQIVDVTHSIPPQNIATGALILDEVRQVYPAGTIHVVVIDPGVGTSRRVVAAEIAGQRFVLPDNGLLTMVTRTTPVDRAVELTNDRFWRHPLSATFHGRDIMAPVAAHWLSGIDLNEFGQPIDQLVRFPSPEPVHGEGYVQGQVIRIDHFGNAITDLPPDLAQQSARSPDTDTTRVRRFGRSVKDDPSSNSDRFVSLKLAGRPQRVRLVRTYGEAESGELVCLIGSSNCLELAVVNGSAATLLGLTAGDGIWMEPE